jgi:hypothetical protein
MSVLLPYVVGPKWVTAYNVASTCYSVASWGYFLYTWAPTIGWVPPVYPRWALIGFQPLKADIELKETVHFQKGTLFHKPT